MAPLPRSVGWATASFEAGEERQPGGKTMSNLKTQTRSDSGGATNSVPLPLVLPKCECPCHVGGEPYSCGGMCWHPQLDADEYVVELTSSTNNVDHYVGLFAIYSGGKLKFIVFEPSNGPVMQFEVS